MAGGGISGARPAWRRGRRQTSSAPGSFITIVQTAPCTAAHGLQMGNCWAPPPPPCRPHANEAHPLWLCQGRWGDLGRPVKLLLLPQRAPDSENRGGNPMLVVPNLSSTHRAAAPPGHAAGLQGSASTSERHAWAVYAGFSTPPAPLTRSATTFTSCTRAHAHVSPRRCAPLHAGARRPTPRPCGGQWTPLCSPQAPLQVHRGKLAGPPPPRPAAPFPRVQALESIGR